MEVFVVVLDYSLSRGSSPCLAACASAEGAIKLAREYAEEEANESAIGDPTNPEPPVEIPDDWDGYPVEIGYETWVSYERMTVLD